MAGAWSPTGLSLCSKSSQIALEARLAPVLHAKTRRMLVNNYTYSEYVAWVVLLQHDSFNRSTGGGAEDVGLGGFGLVWGASRVMSRYGTVW